MKEIYLKMDLNILYRFLETTNYTIKDVYVFKYMWCEGHLIDDIEWSYTMEDGF